MVRNAQNRQLQGQDGRLLVAFCEADLKAMGYLWLIYKRKKEKQGEMAFTEHTPEVSLLG